MGLTRTFIQTPSKHTQSASRTIADDNPEYFFGSIAEYEGPTRGREHALRMCFGSRSRVTDASLRLG